MSAARRVLFGPTLVACILVPAAAPSLAAEAPPARRTGDIADAILPCWHPPAGGGEITLALSLRRDGSVIAAPRVTYVRPGSSADALRASILDAVRACTPLALSWQLGAVIAGQVLRIRFVAAPGAENVRASVIWSGT